MASYVCRKCGKPLSLPQSVERGFGAVCWAKVNASKWDEGDEDSHFDYFLPAPPLAEAIVWERRPHGIQGHNYRLYTNVPHLITRHSPDGYEWGYGGSGPADFALNIVENLLRMSGHIGPYRVYENYRGEKANVFELTEKIYQKFKFAFVGGFEKDGGSMPTVNALQWIESQVEQVKDKELLIL